MSEQTETPDIKKKVLATGIRVGTNVKTKFMRSFINQASPEGLYMLDIDTTLARIKTAAKFVNHFDIKKIIVCSGREYANMPIEKFCELTGARMMLGRFMPGTLTNPSLPFYTEPQLILVSDPEIDRQAVIEATNAGIPVIGIATTYWLLSREILIQKGELTESQDMKYEIDDFETKIKEVEEEEFQKQNYRSRS
jgi:small subunit ribosomal protein S2